MRYQFKTADDQTWVLDVAAMKWGKVSDILGAPSLTAAQNEAFSYNLLEQGDLIPMGGGIFNFQGRTPSDGLCTVGIYAIPYIDTLQLYIRANVPLKEDSFKSGDITTIKHHIIQAQNQNSNVESIK